MHANSKFTLIYVYFVFGTKVPKYVAYMQNMCYLCVAILLLRIAE